jgi:hypothetical protein
VGSSVLREFINGLPTSMRDWYQRPAGITQGKSGEIYLAGTENLPGNDCAGVGGGSGGPPPKKKK